MYAVLGVLPFLFFVLFFALQALFPRRLLVPSEQRTRWLHNVLLFVINGLIGRLLLPLSLVGVATWAAQNELGAFNIISAPGWLEIVLAVVLLDFFIYIQHVATHKIPLLWRLHKVHHADREMDVTTAVRFHPLELVLSMGYKAVAIIALGAAPVAVAIFVLLLFIGPAFNHSNCRIPPAIDRILRSVIVTPDTHRTHHSVIRREQDSNYGFFLIWWDRAFGTYQPEPANAHTEMQLGLPRESEPAQVRVDQMLWAPFKSNR